MKESLLKDHAESSRLVGESDGEYRPRVWLQLGPMRVTAPCFGRGLVIGTVVVCLIALPICIWELKEKQHAEDHIVAWFVGGVFALLACLISMIDISNHLMHFGEPVLQRYMIRIMWMVPIYAVESWLSLRFKDEAIYIETARECYEAYVIYSFTYFMMYYVAKGDETKFLAEFAQRDRHHGAHLPPVKWVLAQWELGQEFWDKCKMGVLQYVVVRLACTLLTFILVFTKKYCNGALTNFSCGYIYITFFVNCSQVWAMYCLVLFYHATYQDLAPLRPFPKFLCIKAVVFFSFWQEVGIAGMVKLGWIHATLTYTTDEVADGLQDFIICIEMFLAAIAHHYYYSYHDVVKKGQHHAGFIQAFMESSLPTDVIQDVVVSVTPHHRGTGSSGSNTPKTPKTPSAGFETTNPLHRSAPAKKAASSKQQQPRASSTTQRKPAAAHASSERKASAAAPAAAAPATAVAAPATAAPATAAPAQRGKAKRTKASATDPTAKLKRNSQFDASFRVEEESCSSGSSSESDGEAGGRANSNASGAPLMASTRK